MSIQPQISQEPEDYGVATSALHDVRNSQLEPADIAEVLRHGTVTDVDAQDCYAKVKGKLPELSPIEDHAKEVELLLNPFEEPQPQVVRVYEQES